jgi:hypothetical protein
MDTPPPEDILVQEILERAGQLSQLRRQQLASVWADRDTARNTVHVEDPAVRDGITTGYNPDCDTWHVEVRQPGQAVDIVPVSNPTREGAQAAAEQLAAVRQQEFVEQNIGIIPAGELVAQVRAAAWMQGEDDPALVAEVVRLRRVEEDTISRGWNRVTSEPPVVREQPGMTTYLAGQTPVTGTVEGNVIVGDADLEVLSPDAARLRGAALIAAAKAAEELRMFFQASRQQPGAIESA